MHYVFILGVLLFLGPNTSIKKETPEVTATLCGLPEGPAKISDLKNCKDVILSIGANVKKRYEGVVIVQYTFAICPKKSRIPSFVEEVKGNTVTQNALGRIPSTAPGDIVRLANVKIRTKTGVEVAAGAIYTIVAE
jgi:hypothetical protein